MPGAERLVQTIRSKGARLAVAGILDLSELVADAAAVARIVLKAMQDMLPRVALQTAYDDHETCRELQRAGIEVARAAGPDERQIRLRTAASSPCVMPA